MRRVVLFVCTGNVCRSPMAAGLLNAAARRAGDEGWLDARSAGTWATEHQPASGHALTVMAERGIDLSTHRSRTVTRADLAAADAIICMTRSHRDALSAEFPECRPKLHLVSELKGKTFDVDDPYGGTLSEYQLCIQELEDLIASGYVKITDWAKSNHR